jgi:hypothetical protein
LVDLFEEVEEELRSDRYRRLVRGVGPWVTGVFALVLVGYLAYWGYTAWQDRNLSQAAVSYQKGVDALIQNDTTGAFAAFEATAKSGAPGYRTLALMQEGDLRLAAGKPDEAAKLYDQAASGAPNQIFADLASLKAAEALLDTTPLAQIETRLTPLTDSKRPYSAFAREALAMAKLMAGQTAAARKDFNVISLSLTAPADMRERAQIAIAVIDSGEAQTAVQAAKLAATLPPPPPATVAPGPDQGQGGPPSPDGGQGGPPSSGAAQ